MRFSSTITPSVTSGTTHIWVRPINGFYTCDKPNCGVKLVNTRSNDMRAHMSLSHNRYSAKVCRTCKAIGPEKYMGSNSYYYPVCSDCRHKK